MSRTVREGLTCHFPSAEPGGRSPTQPSSDKKRRAAKTVTQNKRTQCQRIWEPILCFGRAWLYSWDLSTDSGEKVFRQQTQTRGSNFKRASNMWLSWKLQTGQRAHMATCYAVISNQSGQQQKWIWTASILLQMEAEHHNEEPKERTNTWFQLNNTAKISMGVTGWMLTNAN